MRPKPRLSLALPLAVGVEGLREMCEFELAEQPGADFACRLAAALPTHMRLLALETYTHARSLPARVVGASYEVQIGLEGGRSEAPDPAGAVSRAADAFAAAKAVPVEEEREGRVRHVDVKRHVDAVSVRQGPGSSCTISFRARVTPEGTARPELVVRALSWLGEVSLKIERMRRVEIHLS